MRTKIFVGFSIFVLVLLAISLIFLAAWKNRKAGEDDVKIGENTELPTNISPGINTTNGLVTEVTEGVKVKPATTEEIEKNAAKQVAKIFIERYASYSTDNAFQNIKDVENLVVKSLWDGLKLQIRDDDGSNHEFMGVTTKVFVSELDEWGITTASFNLKVLKVEKKNGEVNNYQDDYYVNVVKEGNKWLVSGFGKE